MIPFLSDFKGQADTKTFPVTDQANALPDTPCRFVKIANFNVENRRDFGYKPGVANPALNSVATSGEEIYYGFNGTISFQLFPGESSDLLPISNLKQLVFQARPSKTSQIWVTYFY